MTSEPVVWIIPNTLIQEDALLLEPGAPISKEPAQPTEGDDVCTCAAIDGLRDPDAVHYVGCPMARPPSRSTEGDDR